jgi:hypothetical protein
MLRRYGDMGASPTFQGRRFLKGGLKHGDQEKSCQEGCQEKEEVSAETPARLRPRFSL